MKIRRKKDGQFIKELEEAPGYRHVVTSTNISEALDFSEENAQRICDADFLGIPYNIFKPGKTSRKSEFERWRL
jgi:hypothetical protein